MMSLGDSPEFNDPSDTLLLGFGQLVPKGDVLGKFHVTHL
jgi:hypothetical protein